MIASTAEFRKGLKVLVDNEPFVIVEFQHVKPGKGGAFVRTRIKSLVSGNVLDRTFRSGDKLELPDVEERAMQYLYKEGTHYHFMDNQTYEQIIIDEEALGDSKNYLKENFEVNVLLFNEKAIGVELPNFVNHRVSQTETWIKGDTTGKDYKPATVETGYQLRIPPFVEEGELIAIDTRTGEFSSRVKE